MWKHIVRIGVMLDIVGVTCKVGQTHAFVLVPSGHVSQKMQSITGRNILAFAKQTYTPKVCVCCLYLLVCELIFQLSFSWKYKVTINSHFYTNRYVEGKFDNLLKLSCYVCNLWEQMQSMNYFLKIESFWGRKFRFCFIYFINICRFECNSPSLYEYQEPYISFWPHKTYKEKDQYSAIYRSFLMLLQIKIAWKAIAEWYHYFAINYMFNCKSFCSVSVCSIPLSIPHLYFAHINPDLD